MSQRMQDHFKKHCHAYLIAFIGFVVSLGLFYALQIQEDRYVLSIAQLGIETINNHIQAELALDEHLLKHVAIPENSEKLSNSSSMGSSIKTLIANYPQVLAIYKLDKYNKINAVQSNNKVYDYVSLLNIFIKQNLESLKTNTSTWTSTPITLTPQQTAFFMVLPIHRPGSSSYCIALIDARSLIQHKTELPGMVFEVYLNHQPITSTSVSEKNKSWLFEVSENYFGASWDLKAQEMTINLGILHLISKEAPLSWITFILGILISLLLARSTDLSELLKERTIILDKINQDLKNEIKSHTETEASKKNLEKALLQGQKLQAIGTLAGGIAHDFNNILYAIRGYVELAREEIPQEGITYTNLGKVLDATYRGQDLISQILTFSRRQHHEFIPLNLKAEISGALALLRPTVPQSVNIQFEAETEGKIMGNKTQIHQVIVNLINNAVDAMDDEGLIRIKLYSIQSDDLQGLKISPLKLNNYCKIEVSDTGHGMDQNTMDRIFEPFFTTKEVGKGTGLGLSTVHSIIKDHLGEILVSSQIGKGSTFTLFFPERILSEEESTHGQDFTR